MAQVDWVGDVPRREFKDIRNTRSSVAEKKAQLLLRLGELINKVPPRIKTGGTVNDVRHWKLSRLAAVKVAGSARSSAVEITSAISNMERLWGLK